MIARGGMPAPGSPSPAVHISAIRYAWPQHGGGGRLTAILRIAAPRRHGLDPVYFSATNVLRELDRNPVTSPANAGTDDGEVATRLAELFGTTKAQIMHFPMPAAGAMYDAPLSSLPRSSVHARLKQPLVPRNGR